MNAEYVKKLALPEEVKEIYPVTAEMNKAVETTKQEVAKVIEGFSDKLVLIIGPCSADNEDSVIDYISRLRPLQEKVQDKIIIVPRIYTNKPRTTGEGYKGMLHQPNPNERSDLFKGILATRHLHMRAIAETGFACADEMLYPENYAYLDDLLAYVAVGARSVEDQQHRLTASAIASPVGMKNPTSGDLSVVMNALTAAQNAHTFIYRGWEAHSTGNPYAHVILRGYVNKHGQTHPNYHYEDILLVSRLYEEHPDLLHPAIIVDANHSNSGKQYLEQIRICKEILLNRNLNASVKKLVKGLMVESYLEDGCQPVGGGRYGQSITDSCLGWDKTVNLVMDLADML